MYSPWEPILWIHRKEWRGFLGQNLVRNPGRRKRRRLVVPRYNNVNGESFVLACAVWRFVHTRFQISNKEFVISVKDISVQLEFKYIQALNLKIMRSRFCGNRVLFGSHSVDWMFGSLVVTIIFLLFCWLVPFLSTVFIEAFLLDLTAHFFFSAITIRRCSTVTAKLPANSMGYLCCGRLGGSEACVSLVGGMTQLTAALMRCDKLSKL